MSHIVYKTTNLVNYKFYISVHNDTSDTYLCSGVVLNKAIKKYGRNNIIRETLFTFNTNDEAYAKEQELVNEDFIKRPDTYNLRIRGPRCRT